MKQKLSSFFRGNIFPILLVCLTIVLCIVNFKPCTWLSGWDTLHPEFDFFLNLKRAFSGVWIEHQGLGAVASQAHPAEIPRIILLFLSSSVLPVFFLRYFYFFLCFILGPLGVYLFLAKIIFKDKSKLERDIFSFLGALFYLLNLGALQHFYVPLEMFATHFASLGWLFLFATKFIQTKKKKYLIFFSLASLLSTSMAHTATLFYAYFLGLLVYIFSLIFFNEKRNKLLFLKRGFIVILTTLIINAFWLLPNLYFTFNHGGEVVNSKISRLFTNEAISQGRDFANLKSNALLKNFLFNWGELVDGKNFGPLLNEWQRHLNHPLVSIIGYLFFAFIIFGMVFSLVKKNKQGIIFIPLFLISYFFLIILNPSLEKLYLGLTKIPLLHEALRFPFTKFSILLMFTYAVFFAFGLSWLYQIIIKYFKEKKKIILSSLFSIITLFLIIFMWPAFQGNFISSSMKVKIPDEYFQLFKWFNQQDNGRIMKLPLHIFWGWVYHDWGYQGAGFIWFGLKQPTLDREFDRWNFENEKAYQELNYAVYSQNLKLLENLLAKYQIEYLLLDKSVIAPEEDVKVLFSPETEELLSSSSKIKLVKEFDFLKVYQFNNLNYQSETYPEIIDFENPPGELKKAAEEKAKNYGVIDFDNFWLNQSFDYQIDLKKLALKPELCGEPGENQIFGLNLVTQEEFGLYGKNSLACIKIGLNKIIKNRPSLNFLLKIEYVNEGEKAKICLAKWGTDDCLKGEAEDNRLFFQFPKNRELKNYELRFLLDTENQFEKKQSLVKDLKLTTYSAKKILPEEIIDNLDLEPKKTEYISLREEKRDSLAFPELLHNQSYALIMDAQNQSGLPLRICLTNYSSKRCDLYENLKDGLNIFFIPPSDSEGQGYDVNLSNYAVGPIKSINLLKSIKIIPLEYQFIDYQENPAGKYITNNQSYEKNWQAYEYQKPFKIKSLGSPVKINGWENGWLLKEETKGQIVFFFLPQLLEYFGFFLILVLIVLLAAF